MSSAVVLSVVALVASILLVMRFKSRLYPVVAAIVAGLEVALALGLVSFGIKGISLTLVLGAILLVAGVLCFLKASGKTSIASSTVVTFVGAIQVIGALGLM